MIRAEGLTKWYGNRRALQDLSFSVAKGEVVGLLGLNGAGKSTVMNIMTGCLAPSAGKVEIAGVDIQARPDEAKRKIGYLPEIPPLYLDMKVHEYLAFVYDIKRLPPAQKKEAIDQVLTETDTKDVSGRLLRNLSKGYRQRIGLAAALLGHPEILVLDEPTVGLDPTQILDIRRLILQMKADRTVILSSHIMQEIRSVCSRVLLLRQGSLVADKRLEDVDDAPGRRMHIRVRAAESEVRSAFTDLAGLALLSPLPAEEEGCSDWEILSDGSDLRETIAFRAAEKGLPLVMMKAAAEPLEELFLQAAQEKE